jgi:tetratricopeptide (TPR) repeat protein
MNKLSQLIALAVVIALAGSAPAASKKTHRKVAPQPRRTAAKSVVKVAANPAPPSKATRPTDRYSSLAHEKAVELTKQAADAYARGDYNRAVSLCKAASDAYPTYARAQTWLGASYHKMGRYDEARSAYSWAVALAPGTVDAQRAERGMRELGG